MRKRLVAYFSAGGVTEKVAKKLVAAASADLYRIVPEIPYTASDLDWTDKKSRSTIEMTNKTIRPALADHDANIVAYDTIFIGFPIWWHTAPTIINTFLESYDFSKKTIVLFATSGGSDFGNTLTELSSSLPDNTDIRQGRVLNGNFSDAELTTWLNSLAV